MSAAGMASPARPSVVLSWAQSADGRIATRTGDSKYLSSPESLDVQQELRRDCDAVLVGIGTVLADDPRLLCRLPPERNPQGRQPLRVVLDSRFSVPLDSVLATTAREYPVLVIGGKGEQEPTAAEEARPRALRERGAQTYRVPRRPADGGTLRLDLPAVLDLLADRGVRSLFVEGGAAVLTSFLAADLADRVILDIAPLFIGEGRDAVADLAVQRLLDARRFVTVAVRERGGNVVWTMERG